MHKLKTMTAAAKKVRLQDIEIFRSLFLREFNHQLRYYACHERGWSDSYLLLNNGEAVGYGLVKGKNNLTDRDAIFEFYLMPPFRKEAHRYFSELVKTSGATFIESQSNDVFLTNLLNEFASDVKSDVILFEDKTTTQLDGTGVLFRKRLESDLIFEHKLEPAGDYVLEWQGAIIATGGFMLHYNQPFADLYMEVDEPHQRKGFGAYLVQELKKECYRAGRVPAARCSIQNNASRNTLLKAGMVVCSLMLEGKINPY
jgi:GNAT superfamily N-acetyltransferase